MHVLHYSFIIVFVEDPTEEDILEALFKGSEKREWTIKTKQKVGFVDPTKPHKMKTVTNQKDISLRENEVESEELNEDKLEEDSVSGRRADPVAGVGADPNFWKNHEELLNVFSVKNLRPN